MKIPKKQLPKLHRYLLDTDIPISTRKQLLGQLCMDGSDDSDEMVARLLGAAADTTSESIYKEKLDELTARIREMEDGPLRSGTFLRMLPPKGALPRAIVLLQDGTTAFVSVPDSDLAGALQCGEMVLLEAQCRAILARDGQAPFAGEEAILERKLDGNRVEVSVRDHERFILHASTILLKKLDKGEAAPGSHLMVCLRRMMAFDALPVEDGLHRYRYLARQPVPDVIASRDLGDPPAYIEELAAMVQMEMTDPDLRRIFGLHRCALTLLTGVSGAGKTFSISALWHRLYEIMSEVTGAPVESLPPRVMHLRQAQVLSKWLGDSDKNLDRFFDETEQLAAEKFTAPDGREHDLPVLAIIEEVDGLARARGDEPIHDRILTTILQRLDTSRPEIRNKLILFVATTNVGHQVDHAFLRRIGGRVEHFGRLQRSGFVAVLDKQLGERPVAASEAADVAAGNGDLRRRVIAEVTSGLYSPADTDPVEVELTYAGSTSPVAKHARDFLTASLVERGVQQAATEACRLRAEGSGPGALTSALLTAAIRGQVRSVVGFLSQHNVGDHLDLPDGTRVATLRRAPGRSVQSVELERVVSVQR